MTLTFVVFGEPTTTIWWSAKKFCSDIHDRQLYGVIKITVGCFLSEQTLPSIKPPSLSPTPSCVCVYLVKFVHPPS